MITLTSSELALLDHRLRERRRELLAALYGEYGDLAGARPPEALGPESHPDETASRKAGDELRAALARHDRDELQRIDGALARITAGLYGACVECGDPIGYERLAAAPYTVRCVSCQTAFEQHRHIRQ
ncbi:TraR/DksA family transcriptional regulator [Paraburkholderia sp. MMS20-SJTN17]|uniref:TraR/DksA family transcriptional regulator n=1 Tax=Paraburkholderia translucens TaxID=2886945 RepID=A0ABS8KDW3_9BURK|nr:TraR/DksA family transcriptional regulator [Paraburkholderia sp. MMS20-SJTN17]MCC8402961.1 TraR/DksA family transcriptional regulator [Paraburkholderia sp. MMS20-SJTN17]